MSPKPKSSPRAAAARKPASGFTAEERSAMQERAKELKAQRTGKADGEAAVRAKIAAMEATDRAVSERLHALVRQHAPGLTPRLWYGMPAYANADGKVVCFFRDARKFKERYMTLGFNPEARLDDGTLWPVAFALTGLTAADEAKIAALVKKAVS